MFCKFTFKGDLNKQNISLLFGFSPWCMYTFVCPQESTISVFVFYIKVLRPSGPSYLKNVEWIPYVFCEEYCSECQTKRVMGQNFGTITLCHL